MESICNGKTIGIVLCDILSILENVQKLQYTTNNNLNERLGKMLDELQQMYSTNSCMSCKNRRSDCDTLLSNSSLSSTQSNSLEGKIFYYCNV